MENHDSWDNMREAGGCPLWRKGVEDRSSVPGSLLWGALPHRGQEGDEQRRQRYSDQKGKRKTRTSPDLKDMGWGFQRDGPHALVHLTVIKIKEIPLDLARGIAGDLLRSDGGEARLQRAGMETTRLSTVASGRGIRGAATRLCGPSEGCLSALCAGGGGTGAAHQQWQRAGPHWGSWDGRCWREGIYIHAMHLPVSKYLNIPERQDGANVVPMASDTMQVCHKETQFMKI